MKIKYKTKLKLVQSCRFYVEKNPYHTREGSDAYSIRCELLGVGDDKDVGGEEHLWLRRTPDGDEFVRTNGYGGKGAMCWAFPNANNDAFLAACEFLTKIQQSVGDQ